MRGRKEIWAFGLRKTDQAGEIGLDRFRHLRRLALGRDSMSRSRNLTTRA